MVIEDSKKIKSKLNGKEVEVSECVSTLRRRLLAEHLGWKEDTVIDPLDEGLIKEINEITQVEFYYD